jgi:hypothetical protein
VETLELRLIALALALAGLAAGFGWFVHFERQTGASRVQAEWDADRAKQAALALAEVQRQAAANAEAANEAQRLMAHARDAAIAGARTDQRVHDYSVFAARACQAASVTTGGASAPDTGDMQTRLLDGVVAAARELAAYGDAARIAGQACEAVAR